ncbi:MAG: outer membrane beta-barrel protein [Planctomycetota bacterium]
MKYRFPDHRLRIASIFTLAALAQPSSASAGIYVDFSAGFPSDNPSELIDDDAAGTDFEFDLDTNSAFSIAVGIDGGLLRNEVEATFRDTDGILLSTDPPSADAGSGSFDSTAIMNNYYLDVPIGFGFEVFAGGGVGIVLFDGEVSGTGSLDTADFDDLGVGFAYQLRGGLAYEITRNLQFTAGVRYFRSSEIDFGAFELDDAEIFSVDLGLRLTF